MTLVLDLIGATGPGTLNLLAPIASFSILHSHLSNVLCRSMMKCKLS